jgi:hypothetical protein
MAAVNPRPDRGPLVACWLVLFLTGAATSVCILLWGPAVGVPKAPGDGSLLILSGITVASISPFALLLLVPARKTAPSAAPGLWLYTRIAAVLLSAYILWVGYLLFGLSQATDL